GLLSARLTNVRFQSGGPDALADDDRAFAVLRRAETVALDLVGDNEPVRLALESNPGFTVSRQKAPRPGAITVLCGKVDAPLPPGRYLLVDPKGGGLPLKLGGPVQTPLITYWAEDHPVLRRVVLSDVTVAEAT